MRSPRIIGLVALVFVGCAGGPARLHPGPAEVRPATVEVPAVPPIRAAGRWLAEPWPERIRQDARRSGLLAEDGEGRLRPDLARSWSRRTARDGRPCWRFRTGRGVAEQTVRRWTERLARGDAALVDLLAGVRGVAGGESELSQGLVVAGSALLVCTARPDPGLPTRLAHPAAWVVDRETVFGEAAIEVGFGALGASGAEPSTPIRRLPAWDGTYALWLNPAARWTSDPSFRRWLAVEIDRDDLVDLALAGRGESARSLTGDPDAGPPRSPDDAPISAGARPRLVLAYPAADRSAAAIASRLKAKLSGSRVDIVLDPVDELPVDGLGRERSPAAVLFLHRPATTDPLFGLLETLTGLGREAAAAADDLRARPFDPGPARTVRARAVEWDLTRDGRLIPLVRAHAWIPASVARGRVAARPGGGVLPDARRPR